jgi:hypothetical protein
VGPSNLFNLREKRKMKIWLKDKNKKKQITIGEKRETGEQTQKSK